MNAIDFFKLPPQYSIFQKEKNKTQYGGVLFLIYLIIMFFISLAYILDYAVNEKFEIEYYMVNTFFSKKNVAQIARGNFDHDVNPEADFKIYIRINYELEPYETPEQNVIIEEIEKNLFMEFDGKFYKGKFCSNIDCPTNTGNSFFIFNITKKILEFEKKEYINIIYKCYDKKCSNFLKNTFLDIHITTPNFEIIHNASDPIKKFDCVPDVMNETTCNNFIRNDLFDEQTLDLDFKLSSILYEEKKGISRLFDYIRGIEKKYRISFIEENTLKIQNSSTQYYYERDRFLGEKINNKNFYEEEEEEESPYDNKKYYILAKIKTEPMDKYEKYMRSQIGLLTVLANIGALFSTLNTIFALFYIFYSKKFDNYEVVEKILFNELRKDKNKIKIKDKNINTQTELSELNLQEKDNDLDIMAMPLIKESSDKEKENNFSINSEQDEIIDNKKNEENPLIKEEGRILPKLSFFEFYFSQIYFKICKRRKNQEIINICDKLIFKYASIDYVLYNLMKLENLFKDYKWNNPELNNIKNNEIIKELLQIL